LNENLSGGGSRVRTHALLQEQEALGCLKSLYMYIENTISKIEAVGYFKSACAEKVIGTDGVDDGVGAGV